MSYFRILGFDKEPFSTSPDPDFFYLSTDHETALVNTIIELRLRRGLAVILGDIGTGKTTLSRKLIQELSERKDFIFNIVLDPSFEDEYSFLDYLARNFQIPPISLSSTTMSLKESLEKFLFQKGVVENKIVVLLVDEAQKLNETSLEALRVLLNYETNEHKLFQLVLLGQLELYAKIMNMPNFMDRISFKYTLNPLSFEATKEMIEFRIKQAGYKINMKLFLDDAIEAIYRFTKGYPRKITMLCHIALKEMVMKNRIVVDAKLINGLVHAETKSGWHNNILFSKGM